MTPEEAEKLAAQGGLSIFQAIDLTITQTAQELPAALSVIMENQNKILSLLTGKSIQDVREETEELHHRELEKAQARYMEWLAKNIQ